MDKAYLKIPSNLFFIDPVLSFTISMTNKLLPSEKKSLEGILSRILFMIIDKNQKQDFFDLKIWKNSGRFYFEISNYGKILGYDKYNLLEQKEFAFESSEFIDRLSLIQGQNQNQKIILEIQMEQNL